MAEYTPSDEQVRTTFVEGASEDAYAMSWHEQYAEAYDRWLAAHDARVRRDAAEEVRRYIGRLHPKGLTSTDAVLADIEIATDRLGRGIHANGRDRETP